MLVAVLCIAWCGDPALSTTYRMVIQAHPSAGGKCWDVPFRRFVPGTAVHLWECNNTIAQIFNYDDSTQQLTIGGLCVAAAANGGSAVSLSPCNRQPDQLWNIAARGDYYQIESGSGRCAEGKAAGDGGDAPLDLQPCDANRAQRLWSLIEAAPSPLEAAAAPQPSQAATSQGTAQTADLAGQWASRWGAVTILVGQNGSISGSWAQETGRTGVLRNGIFSSTEGAVMFGMFQPWNQGVGVASFRLSPDRKKLFGSWSVTRGDATFDSGGWILSK
jgi:hypothetical protein